MGSTVFWNLPGRCAPASIRIRYGLRRKSREQSDWASVEQAWEVLSQFTLAISSAMTRLARGLAGLEQFDVLNYEDLLSSVQAAARHLEEIHQPA